MTNTISARGRTGFILASTVVAVVPMIMLFRFALSSGQVQALLIVRLFGTSLFALIMGVVILQALSKKAQDVAAAGVATLLTGVLFSLSGIGMPVWPRWHPAIQLLALGGFLVSGFKLATALKREHASSFESPSLPL